METILEETIMNINETQKPPSKGWVAYRKRGDRISEQKLKKR